MGSAPRREKQTDERRQEWLRAEREGMDLIPMYFYSLPGVAKESRNGVMMDLAVAMGILRKESTSSKTQL